MKPILFNTQMVRAILDGRKTQTRRIVKGADNSFEFVSLGDNATLSYVDKNGEEIPKDADGLWATFGWDGLPDFPMVKSPYVKGEILYVRETWLFTDCFGLQNGYMYKANEEQNKVVFECTGAEPKWKPSIHMPKHAARLFLRVENVRVERLQDIGVNDAYAEGMSHFSPMYAEQQFKEVWSDTIKEKDWNRYGWDANPWVWVYEFEVISKEEALAA